MMKNKGLLTAIFSASALLIFSCGGGGSGGVSGTASQPEIRGAVIDDRVVNATVNIYDLSANTTEPIATTLTTSDGTFRVALSPTLTNHTLLVVARGGCLSNGTDCLNFNGILMSVIPPYWNEETGIFTITPIQTAAVLSYTNIVTTPPTPGQNSGLNETQILQNLDVTAVTNDNAAIALPVPETQLEQVETTIHDIVQEHGLVEIHNNEASMSLSELQTVNIGDIEFQLSQQLHLGSIEGILWENNILTIWYRYIDLNNYFLKIIIRNIDNHHFQRCYLIGNATDVHGCQLVDNDSYVQENDAIRIEFDEEDLASIPAGDYIIIVDSNAPGVAPFRSQLIHIAAQNTSEGSSEQTGGNTIPGGTPPTPGQNQGGSNQQNNSNNQQSNSGSVETPPTPGQNQ